MSDETSSNSEQDGALDLSSLNFGPAWARDPAESQSLKKFKDRGDRDDRRGGGGRRDDRRGGGGARENRGGGFRGNNGGGHGRRDDDRRPPRQEVEPPEGVILQLMPAEESLDLLAKRVIDSGQTYSVFDLAKVLLQSRDRFRVTFEATGKSLFRCREDHSIWLSRDEALRHLWRGDWLKKYYEEVKVLGEVPKGSFSAVARCGLSNQLLGPPNYHGYQEMLTALHRERYSNMSLDAYKAKVRMEHGEEAVEAWLESMKSVTKWKVATPVPTEASDEGSSDSKAVEAVEVSEPVADGDSAAEEVNEVTSEEGQVAVAEEETTAEEIAVDGEAAVDEEPSSEEEPDVSEEPAEKEELFDDARAVERHFAAHHFNEVFEETDRAWVTGDISGSLLSPGLLTLLKRGVAEEKRYPAKLMPLVCRQLSGRHVAVFKWKKKLKVGPSRPHAVPSDSPLAERPRAMMEHVTKHSGITLKDFWGALMPAEITSEQKHDWFQDFQWLLAEGHIILLSDTTVHLAKQPEGRPKQSVGSAEPLPPKAGEEPTAAAPPVAEVPTESVEDPTAEPVDEVSPEEE